MPAQQAPPAGQYIRMNLHRGGQYLPNTHRGIEQTNPSGAITYDPEARVHLESLGPAILPNPPAVLQHSTIQLEQPPATAPAGLGSGDKKRPRGLARKAKRLAEQIGKDDEEAAVGRANWLKKAAGRAASVKDKATAKQALGIIRKTELSNIVPCLVWGDANSLELLAFWRSMKDMHTKFKNKEAGFKNFSKFAKDFELDPGLFPLLAELDRVQLKRQYDTIMAVKDVVACSGSEGIHAVLAEENLSLPLWEFLCNMHSGNQAADGFGHKELGQSSEDEDSDAGVGTPISDLDKDNGEEAPPSKRAAPKTLNGCPPTVSASVPRRRGRTKEAPKKDNSDAMALRAMMVKTQETNSAWMMDERARSEATRKEQWLADSEQKRLMEEVRRDERCEVAARDKHKDRQRQDELAQAKFDREEAKERSCDAERKADQELVLQLAEAKEQQREADQKAEREEAQLARQEDARQYEAAQARQAYDAATLAILGNLGARGP
ncbi:hypothetical protein PtA15_2A680 [Puccinia triticina]|nr:uncharacterized protein PtA15_2A680 [Puccinia triticina]WAQ82363.1 hypothetical protein PtA15_2A680 [Puccinia triticina]